MNSIIAIIFDQKMAAALEGHRGPLWDARLLFPSTALPATQHCLLRMSCSPASYRVCITESISQLKKLIARITQRDLDRAIVLLATSMEGTCAADGVWDPCTECDLLHSSVYFAKLLEEKTSFTHISDSRLELIRWQLLAGLSVPDIVSHAQAWLATLLDPSSRQALIVAPNGIDGKLLGDIRQFVETLS
jgi:hypothetical protein